MNEMVRQFLGKYCVLLDGDFEDIVEGTIEMAEGNWACVRTKKKGAELVNLNYVCRIREKVEK